jgi:hypothetical protein
MLVSNTVKGSQGLSANKKSRNRFMVPSRQYTTITIWRFSKNMKFYNKAHSYFGFVVQWRDINRLLDFFTIVPQEIF